MTTRLLHLYVALCCAVAAALWALTWFRLPHGDTSTIIELAVVVFASGWIRFDLRDAQYERSLDDTLMCAVFIIGGPWVAILLAPLATLETLVSKISPLKKAFNIGQQVIAVAASAGVYVATGGPVGRTDPIAFALLSTVLAAATYLVVNAAFVSVALVLETRSAPWPFLRQAVGPTAIPQLTLATLGLVVAALWLHGLSFVAGLLVAVPMLVAGWALSQYEAERNARESTLRAFIEVVEAKDLYTRGHSERVSKAAGMLGHALRLPGDRQSALEQAGLLHDVGKVGIPISILRKPGRLTDAEMGTIRLHPARGVELIGDIPFLEEAKRAILHHHEKWDGSGYPAGLTQERIPYFSRIIGIVDAFDCLTSTRAYRAAKSVEEALAILVQDKRTHFDPTMVDVFVRVIREQGWTPPVEAQPASVPGQPVVVDHDDLDLSIAPGRE